MGRPGMESIPPDRGRPAAGTAGAIRPRTTTRMDLQDESSQGTRTLRNGFRDRRARVCPPPPTPIGEEGSLGLARFLDRVAGSRPDS